MATKRCMNAGCMAVAPGGEWRKGWALRAGGFAILCDKCGLAYDQHVFCDIFHQKESGWRECFYCGKRLHCGCIASRNSFDLLDSGGVQCLNCIKASGVQFVSTQPMPKLLASPQMRQRPFPLSARGLSEEVLQGRAIDMPWISADTYDPSQVKWEEKPILSLNRNPSLMGTSSQNALDLKDITPENNSSNNNNNSNNNSESLAETSLSMGLGLANTSDTEKTIMLSSPELTGQKVRHFVPKPLKVMPLDATKDLGSLPHMRVARPPADGRGRNQLLPRYWPRITDQELQQISGDSNSTIVPLFEKVMSASDAGRIGRLVLPKACAEAYFPPISQPEGRPLTIQDTKGKEWHFQFRFWPNNNSRMYVLEGVTPCIQSLQLQAGDTVTFSRIEPGGKLLMGFRKATNTATLADSQISAIANGTFMADPLFAPQADNLQIVSGYSGFLHSIKGRPDHANSSDSDVGWINKTGRLLPNEGSLLQPLQKRSRNIGLKSRRLSMDSEDALELKLTWEEAQDLLRPPPTVKPNVVRIEDYEFEEYDEPPIFGKRTIFTVRASGDQDQWIQCDECFRWRRLTINVIVASKWTCSDNTCDPKYSSCSAPDELSPQEAQNLLQQYEEIKRQRNGGYSFKRNFSELDAPGLDALATAATLGDSANVNQATPSVAPTTKHPRHRPGCSCIVCIQPPSGKGPKHSPSCTCNVCMTVRRRFKTLMMRKKQKQSEREEAEVNNSKKLSWAASKDEAEVSNSSRGTPLPVLDVHRESESGSLGLDTNRTGIDLNFHPDPQSRPSMLSLLEVANRPLESYLKQNGLASLAGEPGGSSMAPVESEERTSNDGVRMASVNRERESGLEEGGEINASQEKVAGDAV
ncbi:B3 domain-containing protein [Carex littledalei]|uniref:B3 domain-containing protein n=1 Tax=Carex littledalei TaxID=544730 RepID=A0A833VB47_9POAL|nr:B3 domain-containing protein [Carex littledalei]